MKAKYLKNLQTKGIIHYSQCWEDPETLTASLRVTPEDDVLSVASGGDNTFALLLEGPRTLTAVDRNPAQLFLVELKMRAIQLLDYQDYVGFLGVQLCRDRLKLYHRLRLHLSYGARRYWDFREDWISSGVIHCGKFERYFSYFRRFVLPLIHTQKRVQELLNLDTLKNQQHFYDTVWSNRRWRLFFKIFFGEYMLGHLGRQPSLFKHVTLEDVASELLSRTRHGLTEVSTRDNFFLEYILTGQYRSLEGAHPYLRKSNFERLRSCVDRIHLVNADVEEYLWGLPSGRFSKVNCSDIFEYMSDSAFERTLRAIIWSCREGARVAFWTLFVPREVHASCIADIDECKEASDRLTDMDRTFFYGGFRVWQIHKQSSKEIAEVRGDSGSREVRTP
jgi:S-adenosylmethionine-diacylglycerol 3-amino-3-carboxypropyl transferase